MSGQIVRNKNFPRPFFWKEDEDKIVKAHNIFELLRGIEQYREKHGGDLRPGWQVRVQEVACMHPMLQSCCSPATKRKPEGEDEVNPPRNINRSDVARFMRVVTNFVSQGGKLVDSELANQRADICVDCPFNVPIRGCMGCSGIIPRLMKLVGGRTTPYDNMLRGCGVCGCQLRAKVHIPAHVMSGVDDPMLFPDHCWVRQELLDDVDQHLHDFE